jgi:hypothetical protein
MNILQSLFRGPKNLFYGAAVACLLAVLAVQAVTAMRLKSPTVDEFAHHIANGYSYLKTRDFRMNPGSPPLSRMLPAVPLIFLDAKLPLEHPSWAAGETVEFAKQFFYHANPGKLDRFVFWSRVPVVILSCVFAICVWAFAALLWGRLGGFAALLFYVFSPNILAHSQLATADLMVAFFSFLTFAAFWHYLRVPSWKHAILTGLCLGGAFLSKYSAVILPPILILTALAAGKIRLLDPRKWIVAGAVCVLTIWAGYGLEIKPLLENTPDPAKKAAMYERIGGEKLLTFAKETPVPLATFASSITSMMVTRYRGTSAYLMGEWSREGWWQYYFVAMAIKETIPLLALAVLGIFLVRRLRWDRVSAAVVLVPIAVFFILTLKDRAQAGIRYFLPIFPCLFILAAGSTVWLWERRNKASKAMAGLFLGWHALEAAMIYPDHLAYFNQLIGGPKNGYKYLRDSNIDWCQDLKGVGVWTREQGYGEVVVGYHGVEDPAYYGIPYRPLEADELSRPRPTVYALGAHGIDATSWALRINPTKIIGHSFFIYDLRGGIPEELE